MSHALSEEITGLLGRPFILGGRGPEEFDCLGLIIWLYRRVWGLELEDPLSGPRRAEAVRRFSKFFMDCDELRTGDVIHVREQGISRQHLALVENSRWAVEASRDQGVRRIRISTLPPGLLCAFHRPRILWFD